ncbi:MAG: GAF domain-containing protein [Betaproteobacteria bacterium]|nr:MAG: GAF domain-containing protein [Betaproteobacteria bacterium]
MSSCMHGTLPASPARGEASASRRNYPRSPTTQRTLAPPRWFTYCEMVLAALGGWAMAAITKAQLVAQVKRLRKSLGRADAKHAALERSLAETLERQMATAEILKVISSSPTDVQPVFDAIARNALTLCGSSFANVYRYDGKLMHFAASHLVSPEQIAIVKQGYPAPPSRGRVAGRAILSRAVVCIEDALADPDYDHPVAAAAGWRRMFAVPMLRDGEPLGAIAVGWTEPGLVSATQQELLKTFADQAVIAIENVRLFEETKSALEQQTAISEILRVISNSPTDVTPVLDAVVERAMRICESPDARIFLVEGDRLRHAAGRGDVRAVDIGASLPLERGLVMGRAVIDKVPVHVEDLAAASEAEFPLGRQVAHQFGHRTTLGVPLLREQQALGVILLRRAEVRPFSSEQIALLKTFADQAAIAIENVRLFNETKEALERQTATSEILRVISSSPRDLRPVFDAILEKAMHLCEAHLGMLSLSDGETYEHMAQRGASPEFAKWAFRGPFVPDPRSSVGRLLRERKPIHHQDLRESAGYREGVEGTVKYVEVGGARSYMAVPMLKEGRFVGGIIIYRPEVRPFTEKQVELVAIFANQAVIAIENVRLFKELEARTEALGKSVQQLTALGEVGQAISSTLDLETVLRTIVSRALLLTGLDAGEIFEYDEPTERFHLRAAENLDEAIVAALRRTPMRKGEGAIGRSGATGEPAEIPEILDDSYQSRVRELLVGSGHRALLAVPLLREEHLLGALVVNRKSPGSFAPETVELLKTFATQSALAIQNARLFREIAEKSRQLEEASRHKSRFLASMSHELRTPLNAILGFNEMILGEIYGAVPADMKGPLEDIQTSGKHLLRLINNVLDLAKIEAGRMELALADYSVQDTVESVRSTLRPLAAEKGLEFLASVPNEIPLAYGDAGRITQCLMNLAGNSLKFTKAGKVAISIELKEGDLVYRVADTGMGIAPEKIGSLFTEFKQTDATIASEYGGSGLGLSIVKKFVELHGGRIWVESEPGKGSSFFFRIPLRAREKATA